MNRKLLGISLAAVLAIAITPALASEHPDFLEITKAEAREKPHPQGKSGDIPLKVEINVDDDLPTQDGTLIGVGVFLDGGNTTAIVTTSHGGAPIRDSVEQTDKDDERWHNHFVVLNDMDGDCSSGISVSDLTWESPAHPPKIDGGEAKLLGVPLGINQAYTSGTDEGASDLVLNTGSTAGQAAVAFTLTAENDKICVNPASVLATTD